MDIVLSNTSGVPIYEQIKTQLKAAILSGELAEGDALPSIRGLARDLQVSVITTTRAFSDLATEGFVTNVPGKGSYVLPRDTAKVREQVARDVTAQLSAAVRTSRLAQIPPAELHDMLDAVLQEDS